MSFTGQLSFLDHDLQIKNGAFRLVTGSQEVTQRIKVALRHYYREYFLNVEAGVPWYEQILGSKGGQSKVSNIIRTQILAVPGVKRIVTFSTNYNSATRKLNITTSVIVQKGQDELDLDQVVIDGLAIKI